LTGRSMGIMLGGKTTFGCLVGPVRRGRGNNPPLAAVNWEGKGKRDLQGEKSPNKKRSEQKRKKQVRLAK